MNTNELTSELRASLDRGLDDSAAGRVTNLGDFTQFINEKEPSMELTQDELQALACALEVQMGVITSQVEQMEEQYSSTVARYFAGGLMKSLAETSNLLTKIEGAIGA